VGGNSRRSRQLVGRAAAGWTPLLVDGNGAGRAGTTALADVDVLRASIDQLRGFAVDAGRDPSDIEVQIKAPPSRIRTTTFDAQRHIDELAALTDAGVDWFVVHPIADSSTEARQMIERYAADVIAIVRDRPLVATSKNSNNTKETS
jgi:hypothetical protein